MIKTIWPTKPKIFPFGSFMNILLTPFLYIYFQKIFSSFLDVFGKLTSNVFFNSDDHFLSKKYLFTNNGLKDMPINFVKFYVFLPIVLTTSF